MLRRGYGDLLAGLACAFAMLGAAYFGLWSCGNYAWKSEAFRLFMWAMTLAAVLLPSHRLRTLPRKLLFPLALWALYAVVESAVAPFYPAAPDSWRAFVEGFLIALQDGPC